MAKHEEVGKGGVSLTKKWVNALVAGEKTGGLLVTSGMRRFLFVVGMAFFWTLPRRSYFQNLFSGWDMQNQEAMNAIYGLFLFGLGVAAILVLLARRGRAAAAAQSFRAVMLVSMAMVVGGGLIYSAPFMGAVGLGLAALGSLLCAIGFAQLAFAWGFVSVRLRGREMFVSSFLGFALSFVLLMVAVLPQWVRVGLSLVAPLASGCCAAVLVRGTQAEGRVLPLRDVRRFAHGVPAGLVAVLVLVLLIGGVIRGLAYPASFSDTGVLDPVAFNGISFIFALCLCLVVSLSSQIEKSVYSIWIAIVSFFVCGLLLVAAVGSQWMMLGKGLIIIGRTYCAFFLWLVLLDAARRSGVVPLRLLSAFFLFPEIVASAISYCVLPLCAKVLSLSLAGVDPSVFAALSCLLLVVANFVFLRSCLFSGAASPADGEVARPFSKACAAVAAAYGLSAREAQVMEYVGQGLSAKVIADRLYLSVSTVQTHTKNIYRKVGVHTKQELIALIGEQRNA